MKIDQISRRRAVKALVLGTVATSLSQRQARAAAQHLDVKDPAATALAYVEDASTVDVKKYANFSTGNRCSNCLQLQGAGAAAFRPCSLFPGKLVAVKGWCTGWTAEM